MCNNIAVKNKETKMKNDDLTFEEIKSLLQKHDAFLTWSIECQMYRVGEREAAIIVTCDKQGNVLSAFCKCGDKMKNFEQEIAQKISDACKNNPNVQKQIELLQSTKKPDYVYKKR